MVVRPILSQDRGSNAPFATTLIFANDALIPRTTTSIISIALPSQAVLLLLVVVLVDLVPRVPPLKPTPCMDWWRTGAHVSSPWVSLRGKVGPTA